MERIGEVNFEEYKTTFFITKKIEEFLDNEKISLANLLPNGWEWYEVELFEAIEDIKHNKKFKVVYNKIILSREFSNNKLKENFLGTEEKGAIYEGTKVEKTLKGKEYHIKYSVYQG